MLTVFFLATSLTRLGIRSVSLLATARSVDIVRISHDKIAVALGAFLDQRFDMISKERTTCQVDDSQGASSLVVLDNLGSAENGVSPGEIEAYQQIGLRRRAELESFRDRLYKRHDRLWADV